MQQGIMVGMVGRVLSSFWRWPPGYYEQICDGLPLWLKGEVAHCQVPQRREQEPALHEAMKRKLANVHQKGYIQPGHVESLTSFFAVPKGEKDIWMVYDGTKSGLNSTLWAPWFPLPTVESHLQARQDVSQFYATQMDTGLLQCTSDQIFSKEVKLNQLKVLWECWG